jgi:adenylate cyclase
MSTPSGPQGSRRLHGVLLADMTGFSRLMGEDEARAVAALGRIRDVFAAVVPRHGGTLDVLVGDCFVALFGSAVDAVQAAIAIQSDLSGAPGPAGDPVRIRIGVHIGDVVRSGSEILGDSVNVAARLQTIARPGAIAVSEDVHRAVRNRISLPFHDLGPKALKNIQHRMRVYEIRVGEDAATPATQVRSLRRVALVALAVVLVAGVAALARRVATRPAILGVPPVATSASSGAAPAPAPAPPTAEQPVTVGVTGVTAQGNVPAWMKDNTRDGLNTLLSKVPRLRVFSREKIDFLRERRNLSEIEVAEALGVQKMIVGALAMDGGEVVLEARVVDIATGILDASESARGQPDDLIELQNQLATELLGALRVHLTEQERVNLFANRSKESLDGYRRLADTFGEAPEAPSQAPARKRKTSWLDRLDWPRSAWAADAEPAIRSLLEAYRAALQAEDVAAVAATHMELSEEQRAGFTRYFDGAQDLRVTLSDVDVLLDGDQALVTFTRHDVFHDKSSGKEVTLEVRLSSVVEQRDGHWLLRGVKKSA